MSEELLDQAIAEVARELTRGEPGSAFRAQVMARINAGDRPRYTAWRAAWVLSPVAVAAIVIAAFLFRTTTPVSAPAVAVAGRAEQARPLRDQRDRIATAVDSASERAVAATPEGAGLAPSRPASNRVVTNRPAARPVLDPLAAPPLAVASIAVDTLAQDPIQIERLDAIAPMTVAPLDIPDVQRRDQ